MIYFLDLLIALFLILLNGAFVIVEFALVKVRYTRLEELAAQGLKTARLAKNQVKHIDSYLSSIQLGITMASLGLGWVGEPALAALLAPVLGWFGVPAESPVTHTISFTVAFAIITGLHVIVGEQAPKYMALLMPEKFCLYSAIPLELFYRATYYPMLLINKSANFILHLFRLKPSESEALHSDEELRMILGQSQEHGKISLGRLMMFEHLFDYGKTRVKEVMTPRAAITALCPSAPWEQNVKIITEKQFSRYPLTSGDGVISGYIHFKDLTAELLRHGCAPVIPDLAAAKRPLMEIQEEISVERALRDFQDKRVQLALVKNVKGEVTGLLTMEDVIEELTGEIRDEFEQPPKLLLSHLIVNNACELELKESGRLEAIKELLEKLHASSPTFNKDEALKALIKRETNFSTALGHQTAFPHARLASLSKPLLAVGKSKDGITFPSPDNQPVKMLFMILTPFNEPTLQLSILAQLSGLISNVTLRKRLFSAKSSENLMDIVHAFENKVMR